MTMIKILHSNIFIPIIIIQISIMIISVTFAYIFISLAQTALAIKSNAYFAGGRFWSLEEAFEVHTPGVINVKNGYAALNTDAVTALPNPTFDNHNGYVEAVWIEYESSNITLSQLIDYYLRNIDPYNKGGQFCNIGDGFLTAIFHEDYPGQSVAIQQQMIVSHTSVMSKHKDWKTLDRKIIGNFNYTAFQPKVIPFIKFYEAETDQQDYYIKRTGDYQGYDKSCERVKRLTEVWGSTVYNLYHNQTGNFPPPPPMVGSISAEAAGFLIFMCIFCFFIIPLGYFIRKRRLTKQSEGIQQGIDGTAGIQANKNSTVDSTGKDGIEIGNGGIVSNQ